MVNVNKKYWGEELKKKAWTKFWKRAKNSRSEKEFRFLLGKFLSSSEQTVLEKRLIILLLLSRNFTYRKIGEIIDAPADAISFIKKKAIEK